MNKHKINIILNIVFALLNFLFAMYIELSGVIISSKAMKFSCYFMFFTVGYHLVILWFSLRKNQRRIILSKKQYIFAFFLSLVFMILLSVVEMKNAYDLIQKPEYMFYLIATLMFWDVFSVICSIFEGLSWERKPDIASNKICIICWLIIFIVSLIFILNAYPGLGIDSDVRVVYTDAINNRWREWHTIGYLWFVKLCISIWDSIYCVTIVHTLFFLLTIWYAIRTLSLLGKKAVIVFTSVLCISIIPVSYLNLMIKDVVYFIGMLALVAGVFRILYTGDIGKRDVAFLATVPLFVTLCRHAGVVTVLLTLFTLTIWFLKKKNIHRMVKVLGIACWHLVIYILITVILTKVFDVAKNPEEIKYTMPIAMMGNAACSGVDFNEYELKIMEKIMPIEEWAACYDPFFADTIARSSGPIGEDNINKIRRLIRDKEYGKKILYVNTDIALRYPQIYFRGLFDMTSIVWEMNTPKAASSRQFTIAGGIKNEGIKYTFIYPFTREIMIRAENNIIWDVLFTRGGFSLFVLFFGIAIFTLAKKRRYVIILLPALLNTGILMLSVPAQDVRYILPAVYTAIFLVSVLASGKICMHNN